MIKNNQSHETKHKKYLKLQDQIMKMKIEKHQPRLEKVQKHKEDMRIEMIETGKEVRLKNKNVDKKVQKQ